MEEILLIRQIRANIANHIHYEMNGENWSQHKYLIEVLERIDSYLKERDREFDEAS